MIKSLTIQNFQSHKDSCLEFVPGINVITGPSNNGKTAIFRALNWIVNNSPSGFSFRSNFAGKKETTKAVVEINGNTITRERRSTLNRYMVGEEEFDAIGRNIPSEVTDALRLGEINFQHQFEKHFLLTDSPGEVGRTINRIVKLENVDILLSNITSKVNNSNKELEIRKTDIENLYTDLLRFEDLDSIEVLVNIIIDKFQEIEGKKHVKSDLKDIIDDIENIDIKIKKAERFSTGLKTDCDELENSWINYNTKISLYGDILEMVKSYDIIEKEIEKNEPRVVGEDLLVDVENSFKELLETVYKADTLKDIIKDWDYYLKHNKKVDNILCYEKRKFKDLIAKHGCPLCERV